MNRTISAMSIPAANPHGQKSLLPPTFEFTKRKRWADLLITEPADTITFVLSLSCTILYCSLAVKELLGWKDADLIDCDLVDLIIPDDQIAFRTNFEESIRNKSELVTYVRLQCNGNQLSYSENVLFEIRGYPPECGADGDYFFVIAKPYPSRNVAILSAYSELKKENERLQQRVLELRNTASRQSLPTLTESATSSQLRPMSSQQNAETCSSFYPSSVNAHPGGFDTTLPTTSAAFDNSAYDGVTKHATPSTPLYNADEDIEEVLKKKAKKTHVGDHYVCITCGRTDSPEWRKGPLGPKTLCNACGLRWAKQMRRTDDPAEGGGEGVTAL